jgi:hypothetical protein
MSVLWYGEADLALLAGNRFQELQTEFASKRDLVSQRDRERWPETRGPKKPFGGSDLL